MRLKHFALIVLLGTLAACSSDPTLDFGKFENMEEALQTSFAEVWVSLDTQQEKSSFEAAFDMIFDHIDPEGGVNPTRKGFAAMKEALDGMTASEVIALADEIRAERAGS